MQLQEETWGPDFTEAVPMSLLGLIQRLGGVVAGAFDGGGSLLGFVFGLPALHHGELVHWSDMLAVRAGQRDRGIGVALKAFQRKFVLAQGIRRICWTFDPLEARNAHVNFARLGATAREYVRDFYPQSESPLHTGIGTDRLIAIWDLASDRVQGRLARSDPLPSAESVAHLPLINAGDAPAPPLLHLTEPLLRLGIPANIQQMKREDLPAAIQWRRHTRAALENYLSRKYEVVEFVGGCYLLRSAG